MREEEFIAYRAGKFEVLSKKRSYIFPVAVFYRSYMGLIRLYIHTYIIRIKSISNTQKIRLSSRKDSFMHRVKITDFEFTLII